MPSKYVQNNIWHCLAATEASKKVVLVFRKIEPGWSKTGESPITKRRVPPDIFLIETLFL